MTNSTATRQDSNHHRAIWKSLRQAIAKSSGFQSWQQERELESNQDLDSAVRLYLKETLETLAY